MFLCNGSIPLFLCGTNEAFSLLIAVFHLTIMYSLFLRKPLKKVVFKLNYRLLWFLLFGPSF